MALALGSEIFQAPTPEAVAAFRRDGAVRLKGVFERAWIDLLARGIEANLHDPSPRFARHSKDPATPAYLEDFWVWNRHEPFRRFVHSSPCAPLAAALMQVSSINLVMDNWFVREAGSTSRPPFHHDIAYFDFEGTMCVLWLPLEPVSRENGIAFVRGSHLWDKLFLRVRFADGHDTGGFAAGGTCKVNGLTYSEPPDVAANPDAYDLLQWDLEVGDCIFFDIRTLHGALTASVPDRTVRRFTLRMAGPDGVIRYRGDWAKQERELFEAQGYREGDRINGPFFPQLWPRAERSEETTL